MVVYAFVSLCYLWTISFLLVLSKEKDWMCVQRMEIKCVQVQMGPNYEKEEEDLLRLLLKNPRECLKST